MSLMMAQPHTTALALLDNALDPFDADQRTRIPAAAGLAAVTPLPAPMPQLTPRALRVLTGIEDAKQGQPANYCTFLDLLAGMIRDAGDSAAVLDQALAALGKARR